MAYSKCRRSVVQANEQALKKMAAYKITNSYVNDKYYRKKEELFILLSLKAKGRY